MQMAGARPAITNAVADQDSGAPGEGDFVQSLNAELLRRARDRTAPQRLVEVDRRLVVGERPHHQALQAALRQVAARRGEETAAEAQPLELRPQVNLVDLAVIEQAARAIPPVVGV